ncbi:hypothetical protein [uncultured Parasutterella sp.]|uniref:hypothetical protein n=1 Tax=uncultured Parasutterella sp. TaxID=1263098 RepID=UPI002595B501|nr:hypothetical protein [uncultured Parasutterella sp.]
MLLITSSVVSDNRGIDKAKSFQREAILAMIQSGVIKMREIDFNNEALSDEDRSDLLLKNLQQLNSVVEGLQHALNKQGRNA